MLLRPRNLILATAAAGTAVTLLFALSPGLHVAYRDPALHAALEATAALVTMLAAYLVFGRFRARGSLDDLVLVCGLALLAASDLCFAAVPAAIAADYKGVFSTWAVVAGRLAGAVAFAAAGFVPPRRLRAPRRAAAVALTICAAFLAVIAVAAAALAPALPRGLNPQNFRAIGLPPLHASPAITAIQLVSVIIFALAAFGFARLAERERDGFMRWLAVGATVAAFSRLNYFLYPSLYTQWVYVGDGFRVAFCLILLTGSLNEIGHYWKRLADAAVLEERRRLARDLHDGVAQEMAYISRNATLLGENGSDAELAERIRASADRAFWEARRAITALAAPVDAPPEVVVADALRDVTARHGVRLELEVARGAELEPERLEALVRVACEAVMNSARHSGASTVHVKLENVRQFVRLRVADRGSGFDLEDAVGYGLVSMRERAESVGGKVWIDSAPGRGTIVEAIL